MQLIFADRRAIAIYNNTTTKAVIAIVSLAIGVHIHRKRWNYARSLNIADLIVEVISGFEKLNRFQIQ
ncbi:MAG: hypothetical protein WBA07_17380 [Rivularia sp. (in: cyanobacteria)]